MNPNFIVIYLCDNDYAEELQFAATQVREVFHGTDALPVSVHRFKSVVIDLMVAYKNLIDAWKGDSTDNTASRNYLGNKLRVEFEDKRPTVDHDGGSIAIDRRINSSWRF